MVNGLITLLAAMILLVILLYRNTQQEQTNGDHHPVVHEPPSHEVPTTAPTSASGETSSIPIEVQKEPTQDHDETVPQPALQEPDDLTKIEGIGPKIAGLLIEGGFPTYTGLAGADISRLQEILAAAGSRYRLADPTTWPDQAKLAAEGDWDKLSELQSGLSGGREDKS